MRRIAAEIGCFNREEDVETSIRMPPQLFDVASVTPPGRPRQLPPDEFAGKMLPLRAERPHVTQRHAAYAEDGFRIPLAVGFQLPERRAQFHRDFGRVQPTVER